MPSDLGRLAALDNRAAASEGGPPTDDRPTGGRLVGLAQSRRRVRRLGALAGLVAPALVGAIGTLLLWNSSSPWRGVPGFGLLVMAAPLLPITGVPAEGGTTRYAVAAIGSAALWLVLGAVAARRATRTPIADWSDWRRHYVPLALGAAAGALVALGLAAAAVRAGLV